MKDRHPQPVSNKKAHVGLDISLYDASLLGNEIALEVAVCDLENNLAKTPSNQGIVEVLASIPRLLEFMLSVIGDAATEALRNCILDAFPVTAKAFGTSLSTRLLTQFSQYLEFLSYSSPSDKPSDIGRKYHDVQRAKQVLEALAEQSLAAAPELGRGFSSKVMKQKGKKQSKRPMVMAAFDSKVFDDLGVVIPSDEEEALVAAKSIIGSQKRIMEYFLHVFRDPHLREAIRRAYVIDSDSMQDASTSHGSTSGTPVQSNVVATETPSAHPFVRPIKAALYFDSVDGFGEWRILISTSAQTDLRRMQKRSAELFRITLKKIKELSQGNFSPDNQKLLNLGAEIPIYEAKMTGDSRLVYQIDCVPEFQMNVEQQAIRIFGIYTHAQLSRQPWDTIGNELGRTGKEYKSREVMKACIFRNRPTRVGGRTGTTVLPASWPALAENDDDTAGTLSYALPGSHQDDLEKAHEMLVLEKYVAFSQALLNSILADHDVMHVFAVSPQEKEIIEHPRSCYVLGRSGTGKTTTMLFKILGIERSWQACEGALVKPRQLFVTQSRVLADKVQEFFTELHASLLTADKTSEELKRMASVRRLQQDDVMVDKDEEVELGRGDLPRRYSELTDEHFPMFVTFDQLCRLLEAEPTHTVSVQRLSPPQADTEISYDDTVDLPPNDYMDQHRDSFVSYGAFLDSYWAHFPQQVTKHLDPALVFSEIIGLIKGSEQSLKSKDGYLDRSSYLKLSRRTQATFATQRNQIYDLFLEYLKHKRRRGDYDAADRTRRILNTIQSCGIPGKQVDFLYVDEAQDNMLIDALLLRSLTSNSDIGLFWAGDTAQTISIGSAFRFNDLKAFLHRIDSELRDDPCSVIHPGLQPTTFQLAVNYRSHAGIVNCAHSVIELITIFWPHAIDRLAPERGRIEGKKPLFLSAWDEDTMRYEQFLFGDSVGRLELGAHQCILVRDDAARRKLRSQVGKIGIILTVYESKGLEFDDVLLYNFFADSTVGLSQWRVILNALPNEKIAAPAFDNNRHNGVCRELKFLYVAITRARKNLWIADDSGRCGPMRDYWDAKGHVEHWTPTSFKDVPRLAVSSTSEQWTKTASMLFKNKRYSQAMHSYEQANLPSERDTAEAYYLREKARTARTKSRTDNAARASAYTKAAEAFLKSAHQTMKEEQKLAHFRIAAECHIQAGDVVRAAQAYLLAQEFTLSANLYRRAGLFDDAVSVIKGHRNSMDPRVVQTIMEVSRLEYLRKRNIKRARALFDSDEDALEYMDDRGLDTARAALLEQLGRFSDAAQVHLDEGRTLEAIPLFLRDRQNPHAHERASYCLLDGLRRRLSFGINPSQVAQSDHVLQELCHILGSQDVVTANLSAAIQDELQMFRAILSNDVQQLFKLSEHFRHWHKDTICALRCLDHGFLTMPKLDVARLPVIAESLHHFSAYVDFLRLYASATDLCDNEGMRRLFAFQIASEDFFIVPKDTFLYGRCVRPRPRYSYRPSDQGALLPKDELNRLLRDALQERLRQKVHDENVLCRRTRAFQVCLHFFTSSKCNRVECPQDHLAAENHNTCSYNLRIRVLLQQILVYNSVHAFENRGEQAQQRVYWLHLLYEALNPPSFKMGTVYSLRPPTIPEYNDGLQIVRHWLFDWLYDITPYREIGHLVREFLTALLQTTSLGLTFDAGTLHYHLPLVQSVSIYRPTEALSRGEEKVYIMQDLERYVRNEHQASLTSGILFVNHILAKRLPVDISALCDFLDVLCGRLVVASQLGHRNTMHDITLPRSWLLRALPSLHELKDKSTDLIELYVTPMADLLEQIYNPVNAEHLLLESRGVRNISSLGFPMRNVFLARICRNLCLLGYNSRYQWLRKKIHCTITSLQRPGREFNHVYSHYVNAPKWEALAWEVRNYSTSGSPFDEMVQLYHAKMGEPRVPPRRNVRRIIYNDVDEILVLLDPDAALGRSPNLNKDATPFVPQQLHVPAQRDGASTVAADEPTEDEPTEDEPAENGNEHDLPEADDEEDADATPPVVDLNDESLAFDAPDPATEQRAREKLDAAQVIAEAYRQYARHRGTQYTTPATVIHLRFVEAYRAVYGSRESMGTREERYRVLLLVPLPHAMVFLELARSHLYDKKNQLKKRLKIVEHLELEEVNNKITQNNEQLKDAIRLIKVLEPRAAVHEKQDYEELRARMREVEQLAGSLPSNVTADWDFYLKTAVAGILSQKPQPTKKPKPKLNMMDDDMVDYDSIEYADDE